MFLLVVIVIVALAVSGLCSILEASLLSTRPVTLSARAEAGDKGAARMLALKENHIEDAISAILTYNTIAHTVGAALSGAQAAVVFGDAWVGVFSGVLTLLILVFTEIIPKTVGTVYADRLAGFSGRVIALMIRPPMKWLLVVTRAMTRLVAPQRPLATTRLDVVAMVKIAERDGAIAATESTVLFNVLRLQDLRVLDVMTPRTVLATCEAATTVDALVRKPEAAAFSRIPVYRQTPDHILGYVLVRELLTAALQDGAGERPVEGFLRRVVLLDESMPVLRAFEKLTETSEHMAVVTDEFGALAGLISLEDIFETAFGTEIVDEIDEVADLREKARALREKRLARVRERWQVTSPEPAAAAADVREVG